MIRGLPLRSAITRRHRSMPFSVIFLLLTFVICPVHLIPSAIFAAQGQSHLIAPMFLGPVNIKGLALSNSIASILGRWPTRQGVEMLPF